MSFFLEATKVKPDDAQAFYNLGLSLWEKRTIGRGNSGIQTTLKYQTNNAGAALAIGRIYQQQKKYNDADKEYSEAIRMCPEKPDAYYFSGVVREFKRTLLRRLCLVTTPFWRLNRGILRRICGWE